MSTIRNKLNTALAEKDVENIYKTALLEYIKDSNITSPYGGDGLLRAENIRTIIETKYDVALKNKLPQVNVLVQVLYYLKKFETHGRKLPSTIFIGDRNECFVLDTKAVEKYLDSPVDWTIAPSDAHRHNSVLVKAMVDDIDILPFVFDVDDNFTMHAIVDKIKEIGTTGVRKVKITEDNIASIFEYFNDNVIPKSKLKTNEKANLFAQILINPGDNYMHPKRKNILCTSAFGDIPVKGQQFKSFFSYFEDRVYSPKEKELITGTVDRLIEDTTRRSKGEFFTPTLWVNEAHKMIFESLGANWKDEYIVWDCCSATCNLTRDYKFKKLFCSTIEQSDIDTANQMGYNKEADKFQFDFLNDPIFDNDLTGEVSKVPSELQTALNDGDKILFFINPPYAEHGNSNFGEIKKEGIATSTLINKEMLNSNMGKSARQLYAQFLYRIAELQDVNSHINIATFAKSLYKTSTTYKNFRAYFYSKFKYIDGMLFNASHFSDTASSWGIDFSIWQNGTETRNSLSVMIKKTSPMEGVVSVGNKELYNLDDKVGASKWCYGKQKRVQTVPNLKSALNISDKENKVEEGYIGSLNLDSNCPMQQRVVYLASSAVGANGHKSVTPASFTNTVTLFTVRKAVAQDWINDKDEYMAPNEEHPKWIQFTKDAIVYSLFNNSSQQSSLRDIDYKGKKWDIKNEWFFMSKDEMIELANDNNYDELYKDAKTSDDRFVYKKLLEVYDDLCPEAKTVLDMARELTRKSIDMRKVMAESDESLHLDSWDCGYAQLKLVWQQYHKEEFDAFRNAYKELELKMIPLVYELGFLKQ